MQKGPAFRYYPNALKTLLLVKPAKPQGAVEVFNETKIKIRADSKDYLSGFIGQKEPAEKFLREKIKEWLSEAKRLVNLGKSQPHAAFAASHGLETKWTASSSSAAGSSLVTKPHLSFD